MFHRQFFVYLSVIPLIVSVSYLEIFQFLSVIKIYIKMLEILIFLLSALISQMALYLIFILLKKSTHSVKIVLSSQYALLCRNCVIICPTISTAMQWRALFCIDHNHVKWRAKVFSSHYKACNGKNFSLFYYVKQVDNIFRSLFSYRYTVDVIMW